MTTGNEYTARLARRINALLDDLATQTRRRAEAEERVVQLEAEVRLLAELLRDVQEGNVPPGRAYLINTKLMRRYDNLED